MFAITEINAGYCKLCNAMQVYRTSRSCTVCQKKFCTVCARVHLNQQGVCRDCEAEAAITPNYVVTVQVRPMQMGNLYRAYHINRATGERTLVSAEPRRTEPDASLDAKLNYRQIAEYDGSFKLAPLEEEKCPSP
jgi:hypothetical protein